MLHDHATDLPDVELAAATEGARLTRVDAAEAAARIDALVQGGQAGRMHDGALLLGIALWCLRQRGSPELARIATAAHDGGLVCAAAMLAEGAPHRALPPRGRLADVGLSEHHVPRLAPLRQTGYLRRVSPWWLRRTLETSGYLERLRRHPSPRFVRQLLEEPKLTLRDVVAIAARRPTAAETLFEVASSPRWLRHLAVRRAIVENPFASLGVAAKLLPTLLGADVDRVRRSPELHPVLRRAAESLTASAP